MVVVVVEEINKMYHASNLIRTYQGMFGQTVGNVMDILCLRTLKGSTHPPSGFLAQRGFLKRSGVSSPADSVFLRTTKGISHTQGKLLGHSRVHLTVYRTRLRSILFYSANVFLGRLWTDRQTDR